MPLKSIKDVFLKRHSFELLVSVLQLYEVHRTGDIPNVLYVPTPNKHLATKNKKCRLALVFSKLASRSHKKWLLFATRSHKKQLVTKFHHFKFRANIIVSQCIPMTM